MPQFTHLWDERNKILPTTRLWRGFNGAICVELWYGIWHRKLLNLFLARKLMKRREEIREVRKKVVGCSHTSQRNSQCPLNQYTLIIYNYLPPTIFQVCSGVSLTFSLNQHSSKFRPGWVGSNSSSVLISFWLKKIYQLYL